MNILTFDTTFDKTYITLSSEGEIKESFIINSNEEKYHSAYLISNIAKILKNNNLQMKDIDKIATNIGPGSFTGIRVCITVAKIISQQLDMDVYGFPSLEILAQLSQNQSKTIVLTDARRGKLYFQVFDEMGESENPPTAIETEKALETAKSENAFIICDCAVKKILDNEGIKNFCFENEELDLGVCLAKLAIKKSKSDEEKHPWYNLTPLYIQPPPISCSVKKR